jgi:hypothetical protein
MDKTVECKKRMKGKKKKEKEQRKGGSKEGMKK